MPSRSPASSSADGPIVVVAVSARILAEAVARSGRRVFAVDLFGDADTRAVADSVAAVPGSLDDGPALDAVIAATEAMTDGCAAPAGVVVGSGFEHRPEALAALATRWPLLGAPAAAVAAVKDPARLAALCAELALPHPEISFERPADPAGWLVKRAGGSGGGHVAPVGPETAEGAPVYYQRRVAGRALSATVVCAGGTARLLAFCAASFAPTDAAPFRFGGLTGPIAVDDGLAAEVTLAAGRLAAATGLVGLVGLDLVVCAAGWWLIEVNPRPTAALDVLDRGIPGLMDLHLAACAGATVPDWSPPTTVAATAVVYAEAGGVTGTQDWPAWCSDRPPAGTEIPAGAPVCTVRTEGDAAAGLRVVLAERAREAYVLAFGRTTTQ